MRITLFYFSILTYASVFIVILFLILITVPSYSIAYGNATGSIFPQPYISLVLEYIIPTSDILIIAFVYGLGTYALPIMVIASWLLLMVSLLKGHTNRIGKTKFWLVVSVPLAYQVFVIIVSNANLVTDPNLILFLYSPQVQFLVAINGQISGLFFAVITLYDRRSITV